MTANSTLTRSAYLVASAAIGLAGTSVQPYEVANLIPGIHSTLSRPIIDSMLIPATDIEQADIHQLVPEVDLGRTDSRWYRYVSVRLRELREGKYDFTGFKVPASDVVEHARQVATTLFRPHTPTPSVVPSEDGDVLYIWHKAGWDIEIGVGAEGATVWIQERSTGREWYGSLDGLWQGVSSVLDYLAWR